MDFLTQLIGPDYKAAAFIIINLIVVESLLSVDNAAVLATMVMDLPENQRKKALKIGLVFGYIFRGLSLLFVSVLIQMSFLKLLGGLYLLWLPANYFYTKSTPKKEDDLLEKRGNFIYRHTLGRLGPFWSTVAMVEFMDLNFSIDNVFAAVAFTDNFFLICTGVFIGILGMRFAAQGFVKLMTKFPFLERLAFIVIAVLGIKLVASYACEFFKDNYLCEFMNGHNVDLIFSILTMSIFMLPVLTSIAFNFPKRN